MLTTDKLFYDALREDMYILGATQGRIYNTVYPEVETGDDKIPYIIIAHEGVQNQSESKDMPGEGSVDIETISVLIVAGEHDRGPLAELAQQVRNCIKEAAADWDIYDYSFSAGPVQYDTDKPCYYQTFTYVCETPNT